MPAPRLGSSAEAGFGTWIGAVQRVFDNFIAVLDHWIVCYCAAVRRPRTGGKKQVNARTGTRAKTTPANPAVVNMKESVTIKEIDQVKAIADPLR
ncbi:MAG: hypothetical protein ACREDR_27115, partial [Blastocatellia bacterium]